MANARRRTQRANRSAARTAIARQPGVTTATLEADDARMGRTIDWQKENQYISTDLRQLLIVSIILFVLLFVVGFFLN